ncbi:ubiquitin-conjugating enzyme E2 M [Nematocida homosporus]|uniref:ubiquitin-conjugating enzyme E2 M n=1 Tax=Nematocida homosporus TaxID=1912981 RepID=UPI00221FA4FB|nr:ubiquitin-conjugating enzyme E2 M [Nematocida homosporus]KAI5186250.1 ubiquitin-conjugating enzyme E2 M [Nematocida homosporus]
MKTPLSLLRLHRELEDISIAAGDTLALETFADGSAHLTWHFHIKDGIYAGHKYRFLIKIKNDYPFSPPKPVCLDPVLHPSIDRLGRVCLNITREDWSVRQGIQAVIFGVSSIFYDIPCEDPLNAAALELFLESPDKFQIAVQQTYQNGQ